MFNTPLIHTKKGSDNRIIGGGSMINTRHIMAMNISTVFENNSRPTQIFSPTAFNVAPLFFDSQAINISKCSTPL